MPNIIEQLEAGKKLQEEEGIDVDSLRTKLNSEEESADKPKSKRGRKKKEENKEQSSENPFVQAEQMLNEEKNSQQEYKRNTNIPEDFDFNNFYEIGQTVYFVKINKVLGEKITLDLKIRTIYPDMFVGVITNTYSKGRAQCVFYNDRDNIFTSLTDAEIYRKSIKLTAKKFTEDEISEQLTEETED